MRLWEKVREGGFSSESNILSNTGDVHADIHGSGKDGKFKKIYLIECGNDAVCCGISALAEVIRYEIM